MNGLARIAPGVEVSPTSLTVTDAQMTYETFERAIHGVAVIGDSARWWLGDLLLFGEAVYGEQYAQAIESARLSERQLNEYRYVCQQVARSRRRENLPFSYHRAVAALEPLEQNQLLSRAESEGWSREQLREAIADLRAGRNLPPRGQTIIGGGSTGTVDAARGLSEIRKTLETVSGAVEGDEAREAVGLPAALRALEEVSKAVRRAADTDSLVDAAGHALEASVLQRGLADPAYIVPSDAWESLEAAHRRAGGAR